MEVALTVEARELAPSLERLVRGLSTTSIDPNAFAASLARLRAQRRYAASDPSREAEARAVGNLVDVDPRALDPIGLADSAEPSKANVEIFSSARQPSIPPRCSSSRAMSKLGLDSRVPRSARRASRWGRGESSVAERADDGEGDGVVRPAPTRRGHGALFRGRSGRRTDPIRALLVCEPSVRGRGLVDADATDASSSRASNPNPFDPWPYERSRASWRSPRASNRSLSTHPRRRCLANARGTVSSRTPERPSREPSGSPPTSKLANRALALARTTVPRVKPRSPSTRARLFPWARRRHAERRRTDRFRTRGRGDRARRLPSATVGRPRIRWRLGRFRSARCVPPRRRRPRARDRALACVWSVVEPLEPSVDSSGFTLSLRSTPHRLAADLHRIVPRLLEIEPREGTLDEALRAARDGAADDVPDEMLALAQPTSAQLAVVIAPRGTRRSIANLDSASLRAALSQRRSANPIRIAVVGDVEPPRVVALIAPLVSALPAPAATADSARDGLALPSDSPRRGPRPADLRPLDHARRPSTPSNDEGADALAQVVEHHFETAGARVAARRASSVGNGLVVSLLVDADDLTPGFTLRLARDILADRDALATAFRHANSRVALMLADPRFASARLARTGARSPTSITLGATFGIAVAAARRPSRVLRARQAAHPLASPEGLTAAPSVRASGGSRVRGAPPPRRTRLSARARAR